VIFIMVYIAFRIISAFRFSTGILSFIYTFTVMLVLVFAIEIQQALTSRGTMDFQDAVVGMYGFFIFFFVYTCIVAIGYLIKRLIFKKEGDWDKSNFNFLGERPATVTLYIYPNLVL